MSARVTTSTALAVAILFGSLVPGSIAAELTRSEAIAEMRRLSEKMADGHFSTGAKQRSRQFLRLTEMREWRDQTGKYSVTAQYVGHDNVGADVQVSLRKTTGEVVRVPVKQLAIEDQKVVKDVARVLERLQEDALAYRDYLADRVRRGDLQASVSGSSYRSSANRTVNRGSATGLGVNPGSANGLWVNPYGSFTGWESLNGPYYSSSWNVGLNPYGSFNYYGQPAYVTPYIIYNNPRPYPRRYYYPGIRYGQPNYNHYHHHPRPGAGRYPSGGRGTTGSGGLRRGPRSPLTGGNVYGY